MIVCPVCKREYDIPKTAYLSCSLCNTILDFLDGELILLEAGRNLRDTGFMTKPAIKRYRKHLTSNPFSFECTEDCFKLDYKSDEFLYYNRQPAELKLKEIITEVNELRRS